VHLINLRPVPHAHCDLPGHGFLRLNQAVNKADFILALQQYLRRSHPGGRGRLLLGR